MNGMYLKLELFPYLGERDEKAHSSGRLKELFWITGPSLWHGCSWGILAQQFLNYWAK